jgi:hypothetical protein
MSLQQGAGQLAGSTERQNYADTGPQYDAVLQVSEGEASVTVPGGRFLLQADFSRAGSDLLLTGPDGTQVLVQGYFDTLEPLALTADDGALLPADLVKTLTGSQTPGQYAQADGAIGQTPIGRVTEASGDAVVTRVDGLQESVSLGAPVFQGDVLETGGGAAIAITFVDETVFSLGEDGRMVLDELIYDPSTQEGFSTVSVLDGIFVFVSGEIAANNPDEMLVRTPVATIGVRGTIVGGQSAQEGELNTVVLLPDAQGGSSGAITYQTPAMATDDIDPVVISQAYRAVSVTSVFDSPTQFEISPNDVSVFLAQMVQSLPDTPIVQQIQGTIDGIDAGDLVVADFLASITTSAGVDEAYQFGLGDAVYDPEFSGDFSFTGTLADLFGNGFSDQNSQNTVLSANDEDPISSAPPPKPEPTETVTPDDSFNDEPDIVLALLDPDDPEGGVLDAGLFERDPDEGLFFDDVAPTQFLFNAGGTGTPPPFGQGGKGGVVFGTPDDDTLFGTAGAEEFIPQTGVDVLTGLGGSDRFVIQSVGEGTVLADGVVGGSAFNTITDFGADDTIVLDSINFGFAEFEGGLPVGSFAVVADYDGTNSGIGAGQPHVVFDLNANTVYADTDSGTNGYTALFNVQPGATVGAENISIEAVADIGLA